MDANSCNSSGMNEKEINIASEIVSATLTRVSSLNQGDGNSSGCNFIHRHIQIQGDSKKPEDTIDGKDNR